MNHPPMVLLMSLLGRNSSISQTVNAPKLRINSTLPLNLSLGTNRRISVGGNGAPSHRQVPRPLLQRTYSTAAAASPFPTHEESIADKENDTNNKTEESKNAAWQLASEVLWPDRFFLAFTLVIVIISTLLVLAFPIAIGDLFDIVRGYLTTPSATQLAAKTAAAAPSPGSGVGNLFIGGIQHMICSVRDAAAAAPPAFGPALSRLSVCLLLSTLGNCIVSFLAPFLANRFAARLRKRVMAETLARDQSYFDSAGKGDITSRLSLDITVVQATVDDLLGQRGFRSLFEILFTVILITVKNPLLAMVGVLSTPLLAFVFKLIVAKSAKLSLNRQGAAGRAMEFATERLTHVRTVKIFAAEDREGAAYSTLTQEGYNLATKCAMFQGFVEGYSRLAINTTTLSLLAIGGALVLAGKVSLGLLLSFNVFNVFLGVGLATLAASLGDMGKTVGAMERIAQVLQGDRDPAADVLFEYDETTRTRSTSNKKKKENVLSHHQTKESLTKEAAKPNTTISSSAAAAGSSLELRDVWFKYQGRSDWALQGLTLSISPGSTLALVGPSGGGKSTTAALLLGLYTPQKGQVLLDNIILDKNTIANARKTIGTVLQQPALMSGTVAEQIALGCSPEEATEESIIAAADAAHASGFINALPEKFNTQLGERGAQLSGGQQQRLSIARALVRHPRLLLLDEPTAALDVDAERAVDEALQEIKGVTKVIIAHRLSTIRSADSIAVIVGGRVVEQGTHADLMAVEGGQYKRMVMNSELGGGLDPELVGNGSSNKNADGRMHEMASAVSAGG